ncbi:MAG: hypothetical protein ACKVQV_11860 [Bacteroidia bacterium]
MKGNIYLILSFLAIAGCSKTVDCEKTNLILSFNAKTVDSLSDFTLYRYQRGSNLGVLIDSLRIINGAGVYFQTVNTSTRVYMQSVDYKIVGAFDWKLHLYSTTVNNGENEIAITNIEEQQENMKCKKKNFSTYEEGCQCMNPLRSYKLNGVTGILGSKIEYNQIIGYEVSISP